MNEIKSKSIIIYILKPLIFLEVYWWEKLESDYMELLMYQKLWKIEEKNEKNTRKKWKNTRNIRIGRRIMLENSEKSDS